MRVVVDGLAARTGGGITYLRALLPAVLAADAELEVTLLSADASAFEPRDRLSVIEPLGRAPSLRRRLTFELRDVDAYARQHGGDLLFCPSEVAPLRLRLPVVLGFQNPNLWERPVPMGAAVAARTAALRALARRAARSATACVFVSEHLRQRAGIEGAVVSPPLDPLYFGPPAPHAQFERLRPYVLTVGDIYAYKNLTVLVDALAELPNAELRLVIAGRRVQETEAARIERRADELGVRERIVMLGAVPHDSMPALYSGAACFAFASLLESFGFPPLEAMACGVPVAAARASAMPSILGDAPEWFAPHDPDDAAGALARLLAEPGPAVERGRAQARLYDPAAAGAALADVWRRAAAYHRLP